ncbi:5-(carboxyamino)imidazole ribonucleotide synthase [Orenia metallireducens]|uniref:N5-carboxyaminoimidazole ribonucleotide synthase n=1 Tax=Orenia metallireducens TaxID=1413210 RepID=A0A285G1Z2_9FIRM|nr:5-(carboxyamino)imidazole ribonucleotide synthase [Orenia metallireducens]PRX31811.1 5-(carboxyamino)imidazole ribonucleotide synthase [Orenia metallireducens]SNY17438.1 5-(carboxyamino)imidazole ribonucleotide synthase [Orenia metallireducens]
MSKDPTKQKIGIIGGGQLGKMMILEAKKMDFKIIILDPTKNCPAHSIADEHIVADFDDEEAIRELANKADVITYEFEHIGIEVLKELEDEGYKIYPTIKSLEIIQNKYQQKEVLAVNNIAVPDFISVSNIDEIKSAGEEFAYPMMLKSCTGGYDGKGNAIIKNQDEVVQAYESLGAGSLPLMIERFVPFIKEISILACRGIDGEIAVYPVAENDHQDSILIETRVPAEISDTLKEDAISLAHQVMEVFEGVGIFCIEMFVTEDERLLINEIAPRPHNSGHYTIEGSITSQFEQHIRAITGLPLGATALLRPIVMRNILGEGQQGEAIVEGMVEVAREDTLKVHVYGKEISKPKRKMGHFTVTSDNLVEAIKKAEEASKVIKIKGQC